MMKRTLDIVIATLVLIILLFPMMLIMCIIRIKLGGPIFFHQLRAGLNGKPFKIIKFRTMTEERDLNGCFETDKRRVTPFGRFLRSTSIDEIPELLNVLKGEMSLVGPRPLLYEYILLYNKVEARRHLVRPGVTGWAQVNGRNSISWEEKFRLDIWYVENHTMLLDLKILLLTIRKVFAREGISSNSEQTMPKFTGSNLNKVNEKEENF